MSIEKQIGAKVLGKTLVGEPGQGSTQTFITVGAFDNRVEAENCQKYLATKFVRAMLSTKKVTQHNPPDTWQFVPMQDFTPQSDIDWSQDISDIDIQLYKKYHLSLKEIIFIETHIRAVNIDCSNIET